MPLQKYARISTFWLGGKNSQGVVIPRRSTGTRDPQAAQACFDQVDKISVWSEAAWEQALRRALKPKVEATPKISILKAREHYLKAKKRPESTKRNYTANIQKLIDHSGLILVEDVKTLHLEQLQASWQEQGLKPNSIRTYRRHISCFLRYCFGHDWIEANPWLKVGKIDGKMKLTREQILNGECEAEAVATLPLDRDGNANWLLIQSSVVPFLAKRRAGARSSHRQNPLVSHPENFLALLELMYETGLRRIDATSFRPDELKRTEQGGWEYTTRQIKTGDPVSVYPPDWLAEKLRTLPRLDRQGKYCFWDGVTKLESYMTSGLNRPLQQLGDAIGVKGLRPHRFRDSFAVNFLNLSGNNYDALMHLLGHKTRATTEKYYSPHVDSRKKNVEATLRAARQGLLAPPAPPTKPLKPLTVQ